MKHILIALFVTLFSIATPSWATTGTGCSGTVEGIPHNSRLTTVVDIAINGAAAKVEYVWIGDLWQCDYYNILNAVYSHLLHNPSASGDELTAYVNGYKDANFDNPGNVIISVTRS